MERSNGMKLTGLIAFLKVAFEEHGDLPVQIDASGVWSNAEDLCIMKRPNGGGAPMFLLKTQEADS